MMPEQITHRETSETFISLTLAEENELDRLGLTNALKEALLKFRRPGTPASERLRAHNEMMTNLKSILGISGPDDDLRGKIKNVFESI